MTKNSNIKKLSICLIFIFIYIVIKLTLNIYDSLPSIQQLDNYVPNLSTKIYDRNNNLIAELFTERRTLVNISDIPYNLINAFIAIEDQDFFKHCGISIKGIIRAICKLLLKRKIVEGGSTITQQLVKILFLTGEKTVIRKIKEILLSIHLERHYSKYEILQLYLNQVYFGNRTYGVQAAAKLYFNKDVKNLSLAECATLAAIPKSPNYYNPFNNDVAMLKRRNIVLYKMKKLHFITDKQAIAAYKQKLPNNTNINNQTGKYIIEIISNFIEKKYGKNTLLNSGLSIYTTIDLHAQMMAEKILNETLLKFDENKGINNINQVQGALISLDINNGEILAMVGGRNFQKSQFNRATQATRQAGSSFKPFIYLTALENGLTASTILNDVPIVFIYNNNEWELMPIGNKIHERNLVNKNTVWSPKNYNNKYRGKIILKMALALSINTCAVELIHRITPIKVIAIAKKLGISTKLDNSLTLALGASDVILQDMVAAFATFASGGIKSKPYIIRKIFDKDGRLIEQFEPYRQEVLSKQVCFIITDMLQETIEKGSGWYAKNLNRPCAGKTGTTNNSSDVWFIGYTPQIATGVWVGYDNRMSLGPRVTGGNLACPIWTKFMKEALIKEPILKFKQPNNIKCSLVDIKTGIEITEQDTNIDSSRVALLKENEQDDTYN
ncbi:MAG: PBP1A family penicillin-binding protein [Endomicrobium sp.]|jgi:penicillin-binding protein 1A|nr:PBP1A family penicillin-binding protein [Endomicrobium sp.]